MIRIENVCKYFGGLKAVDHVSIEIAEGSITGLILSLVMLRSTIFSKATAYVRITSSVLDFGLFIPVVGLYVSALSAVLLLVWNIMIARRMFQLGKNVPT